MLAGGAERKRETDHPVITALQTHPGDPVTAAGSGYYFAHTHTHKEGLSEPRVCFYYLPQTDLTLCLCSPFILLQLRFLLLALFLFITVSFPVLV